MSLSSSALMPRANDVLSSRETTSADSVDHAHETISKLFCEHRLNPLERGEVHMRLRSAHEQGVGIELLDYGEAVRIDVPAGLEDFYLVQLPLSGRATMDVGNAVIQSSTAAATLPPLDRAFTMRWSAGTPTLIMYVQRERLLAVAESLYGLEDSARLQLGLHLQMNTVEGASYLRALIEFHEVLEHGSVDSEYAKKLSAELLLARMLGAVENSANRALDAWKAPEPSRVVRGEALARRFAAAIEEGAARGVGVLEIAQELGVPLRTLQEHVRVVLGSTPSALLRESRLRRSRQLLTQGNPTRDTVTAIAETCGFGHLGRFASDYRARFGESPAQTLRG